MNPAFVYSPGYDFILPGAGQGPDLGNLHLFDTRRASRAWDLARESCPGIEEQVLTPEPVTAAQLRLVHDAAYLKGLDNSRAVAEVLEMPQAAEVPFEHLQAAILRPQLLATGGTLLALRAVFERGLVINLSGGYHHAKGPRGEGFCFFSDLAIAAAVARRDHGVERVAVIDLDAHQGNGVSSIVRGDESVAVFDIYNGEIYPDDAEARAGLRWDHPIPLGCSGPEYLELLERELPRALDEFEPQLVLYNAGTDLVAADPLGQLELDEASVRRRDAFVLEQTRRREVPTITTASGGYSDLSHQLLAAMIVEQWRVASGRG